MSGLICINAPLAERVYLCCLLGNALRKTVGITGVNKLLAAISLVGVGVCIAATSAVAQYACPVPHEDYRRPVPVWEGFGYK